MKFLASAEIYGYWNALRGGTRRSGARRHRSRRDRRTAGRHVSSRPRRAKRVSVPHCGLAGKCAFCAGAAGPVVSRNLAGARPGAGEVGPSRRGRSSATVSARGGVHCGVLPFRPEVARGRGDVAAASAGEFAFPPARFDRGGRMARRVRPRRRQPIEPDLDRQTFLTRNRPGDPFSFGALDWVTSS